MTLGEVEKLTQGCSALKKEEESKLTKNLPFYPKDNRIAEPVMIQDNRAIKTFACGL